MYKAVSEPSEAAFDKWLDTATVGGHGHRTLNLVGPASASDSAKQIPLAAAATRVGARGESLAFGCVTIAERHVAKGREHLNILRKQALGAQWFISQAVYDAEATVRLVRDYASECERTGVRPAKIILTFAPCGRPKTMQFIRWLGIQVPEAVESRVLKAAVTSRECAVNESIVTCCEALTTILEAVGRCGVPLGISVESVSCASPRPHPAYHTLSCAPPRSPQPLYRRRAVFPPSPTRDVARRPPIALPPPPAAPYQNRIPLPASSPRLHPPPLPLRLAAQRLPRGDRRLL